MRGKFRFDWAIFSAGLLILGIFIGSAASVANSQSAARTYYESLELDTPEHAVQTFADAFHRQDFATVFLVLAPDAQRQWQVNLNNDDLNGLFLKDSVEEMRASIPHAEDFEHVDMAWLFDTLMLTAANKNALLIDVRGQVSIQGSKKSGVAKVLGMQGRTVVDVTASVEGIEGQVIFRTVQSPSQRWRVLQIIVSDGDEGLVPWSVPIEQIE